jgi:hypothetical protein
MTIEDLARRTGVAVKVVRRQQDMGLIYTRRRTPPGIASSTRRHCAAPNPQLTNGIHHRSARPPAPNEETDPDSSDQYGVVTDGG